LPLLKRLKNEKDFEEACFVMMHCQSDSLELLAEYRNKSMPHFLFYRNGVLKVRGGACTAAECTAVECNLGGLVRLLNVQLLNAIWPIALERAPGLVTQPLHLKCDILGVLPGFNPGTFLNVISWCQSLIS
jgi:hypothetical protein